MLKRSKVECAWRNTCHALLARGGAEGWRGTLSSSAIATAVGLAALHFADAARYTTAIRRATKFLLSDQNDDGGWGDSPESPSNLAATLLTWAALNLAPPEFDTSEASERTRTWLQRHAGGTTTQDIAHALAKRYGHDKTFAGPILMFVTACGRPDAAPEAWADVLQLPFELAIAPAVIWKWLRLSVVSYGLPALIAVGLARHSKHPSANPLLRALRSLCRKRVLDICASMQPANGGFEEAAPLTGFVAVGLSVAGHEDHIVVRRCTEFLINGQREDGSWPIDSDLATWVTTLAVNALDEHPDGLAELREEQRGSILTWLLDQQHRERHPLTHTEPGGWAWSDLEGAMPDADDTPGAMMAIRRLARNTVDHRDAVERAAEWLMSIQNRDGGIPTFNKGWGKLPFDRSCPDLTAHVLRSFGEWHDLFSAGTKRKVRRSSNRMLAYLATSQDKDGAWTPLWFGNQYTGEQLKNRIYGTAQTLIALTAVQHKKCEPLPECTAKACAWLESVQQTNGSWGSDETGGPSSVEETALAVRALLTAGRIEPAERGIEWLLEETELGTRFVPTPIGLYFAVLFYSEEMYPLVWTLGALGAWLAEEGN